MAYSTMNSPVLQLDPRDNVLVALTNLKKGEAVEFGGKSYSLQTDVAAKHKFATADLAVGDAVLMYGGLVGKAAKAIAAGEVLTTGNMQHQASPFHGKSLDFADFSGLRAIRRASWNAELLGRSATGFLREQEYSSPEAGV